MKVEITNQFIIDPDIPIHFGEVIKDADRLGKPRGQIGWLDWCNEAGSRPGIHTARLMITNDKYGIKTEVNSRTPQLKIGTELFLLQVDRLRTFGYTDLCIFNVTESSYKFYKKVINQLLATGVISKCEEIELGGQNTIDDHSLRLTFSPKPRMLPDTETV